MTALILSLTMLASQDGHTPPGPIEQALIEHRCLGTRTSAAMSGDPYHDCLAAQLVILRNDFGADLKTLSASDRRKLDSVCSRIRNLEGRERYVACLSNRLAALHAGRAATDPAPPRSAAAADAVPALMGAAVPASPSRVPSHSSTGLLVLVGATVVAAGAGCGAYVFMQRPPRRSACRACRAAFDGAGDLCPACRHQAAEAVRAAHERDEQARAARENAFVAR